MIFKTQAFNTIIQEGGRDCNRLNVLCATQTTTTIGDALGQLHFRATCTMDAPHISINKCDPHGYILHRATHQYGAELICDTYIHAACTNSSSTYGHNLV